MTSLAPTLQAFFTDRLISQRRASPHTITGYRDTFRLLLDFTTTQIRKPPSVPCCLKSIGPASPLRCLIQKGPPGGGS